MLLAHMLLDRTCAGVSAKTLGLYACVFIARWYSVFWYPGYLPLDHSGDYVPFFEMASFIMATGMVGSMLTVFRGTYAKEEDSFGKKVIALVPHEAGPLYIVVPCLVFALILHPSLNNDFSTDVAWTFSMYLETLAIIPQLVMFRSTKKPVERWTGHFVFVLGASRLLSLLFWMSSFHELGDRKKTPWVGYFVVFMEFLALAILADYSYFWVNSQRSGQALNFSGGV